LNSLLQVRDLKKYYPVHSGLFGRAKKWVRAVDGISFDIGCGETLGLVGESGCGKTTAGRSTLRLIEPTGGSVVFEGTELVGMPQHELVKYRTKMQIIFQDPYSSLNPRRVVLDLIGEGLSEHGLVHSLNAKKEKVVALLERVGLPSQILYRYPHEFSGGQRQRIAIARAISLQPQLLVCDEPVSALDVSIQAQIINLLIELRNELQMAYLFIAHDLSVVKHVSHRIAVMYLGQIVEIAPAAELFNHPLHPYTSALLSAIPLPDPEVHKQRIVLTGEVDNTLDYSQGCCFASRCPAVTDICRREVPPVHYSNDKHYARCFRAGDDHV
jgi:oligopeptide/dipeptide ABC transporter, ATP-binding protein, C-terminal domain